jgi:hypothetical protein
MESKLNEYKNVDYARQLLSSSNFVAATPLLIAADIVTNGGALTWEYETIFDELEDNKCLPTDQNRDKLMASISALHNPAFLWDAGVFKSMCQSLNGSIAATHLWEQLSPAKVSYAMDEIDTLHDEYQGAKDLSPLYSDSPLIYMGATCAINGFIRPPKKMDACEKVYHRFFNLREPDLRTEVASSLETRKHQEVDAYCNSLANIRREQLKNLRSN